MKSDFVPGTAIDCEEVFRRGGRNLSNEYFELFKCPSCARIYLMECEVDTIYLDGNDLSRRAAVDSFACVHCGQVVAEDQPWVGRKASPRFAVTWTELAASDWAWVAQPWPGQI
jgi:hypothetical protein